MIVILCHPDDAAAVWLEGTLRSLGVGGIEIVTVEQLVFSRRIVHRLGASGDGGTIDLADGRCLRPEGITGLVNRIRYLPTEHFSTAATADRAYAAAELSAFMLAWLNGVPGRVINPARPSSLDGGTFQTPTVVHLAAMAGLPTRPWRASSVLAESGPSIEAAPTETVVVFDGGLFGAPVPPDVGDGCRRLAALLGVPLLHVFLHRSGGNDWRFVDASGAVDFRIGGRPLATAIAQALDVRAPA
jgi:hypothetical protein